MAPNDDPPWLRPPPTLTLSKVADEAAPVLPQAPQIDPSASLDPHTRMISTPAMSQPTHPTASNSLSDSDSDSDDGYVGWRPQLTTVQQAAQAPPLSPLDLAMYPGAPLETDPVAARKAVAGLRPLRILSSRRPGGPASAGPSRPPSTGSMPGTSSSTRLAFVGLLSAAKRASGIVTMSQGTPSSSSPRTNQSLTISHAPIPVSPLPPPRTPPLVPELRLAPELSDQMEPALKAYLESLAAQNASKASSARSSPPRRGSQMSESEPIGLTEEEKILLGIRDLDAANMAPVQSPGAVNRKSQSTSHRLPSISEFVIRDLDAQPHAPLVPPAILQAQRLPTPSPPSSPNLRSPTLLVPNPQHPQPFSPVTPCTEAAYVNRDLELTLYDLERALGRNPQPRSHSQSDSISIFSSGFDARRTDTPRTQTHIYTPQTAHTTSSHVFSVFSSRTASTPLTTPPASPPPLPRLFTKQPVDLPCMVCSRPMQNTTSTLCGHVFCKGCIQGRSACPVCRSHVQDSDLRAIHLFV